jgi:filamentous hemagglutinin family protein
MGNPLNRPFSSLETIIALPAGVLMTVLLWTPAAGAQVRAEQNSMGTRVNRDVVSRGGVDRDRFLIDGGTRSGDRQNLFHSFEEFGLTERQIATFLSDAEVRNILSRVVGGNASIIDGLIEVSGSSANLYLLNPAGIVFGPNSQLNVAGDFTATTATGIGFADGWFGLGTEGDYSALVGDPTHFAFAGSEPGSIINAGTLNVSEGSALTLLGGTVVNTGTLAAPGGTVTVAAVPGDRLVRISQEGMLLSLEVTALDDASGATEPLPFTPLSLPELLTGDEIRSATNVSVNEDGTVTLAGSGLSIPVQPGTAIASGILDTSMADIESTPMAAGVPQIHVLGDWVALLDATLDASSHATPGLIQVGGGYQGNGWVPNADHTYVDRHTVLRADGVRHDSAPDRAADGGQIVTWADNTTQFYGTASAQGDGTGAEGGLVEISGSNTLAFDGMVDVSSPHGRDGTVLFDPTTIIITDFMAVNDDELDPNVPDPGDPGGVIFFDDASADPFSISPGAIESLSGNVRLQAHSDIIIESQIQSSTIDALILQAGRSIFISDPVDLTNGSFFARINDEGANPAFRSPGEAQFFVDRGELDGVIFTTNGDITVEVGSFGGAQVGAAEFLNTIVRADNGAISITGVGGVEGDGSNPGVILDNSLIQSLDAGGVVLQGRSIGTSGDVSGAGVQLLAGTVVEATGSSTIVIEGTTGNASTNNVGVDIVGSITSGGGDILIRGTSDNGGIGGTENYGIRLAGGTIKNTGTGSVTLEGTVGAGLSGTTNTAGIAVLEGENGNPSSIQVEGGAIRLNGQTTATEPGNYGILLSDGSEVLGNGIISFTGAAPADAGIALDNGVIDAGTGTGSQITLTADTIDLFNGSQVSGAGRLTVQPLTRNQDIQLGGSEGTRTDPVVTDRLLVSNQDLAALQDGFARVTFGRANSTGQMTVDGTVVFSDRTVMQSPRGGGSIDTTGGTVLVLDDGALGLEANRDIVTGDIFTTGRNLSITSNSGAIDTTGGVLDAGNLDGGGTIRLEAAQDITLGDVSTSAIASSSSDGSSLLEARDAGNIRVTSLGGTVRVEGAVTAIADGDGQAGNGGRIRMDAGASIVAPASATLATFSRSAQGNAGNGGAIRFFADGNIRLNPRLDSSSTAPSGSSGSGGRIRLTAGRTISLENGADSSTAAQQGTGGRGNLRFIADRAVTVNDTLNTSASSEAGLSDRGGAVRIQAGDDILLNGLDTSAEQVSPGGEISLDSTTGTVRINSAFPAADSANRSGGSAAISGFEGVRLAFRPIGESSALPRVTTSGGRFLIRSDNGPINLTASDPMAIATAGGRIRLRGTEVTTRNIRLDSSSASGTGGAIAIIATDGAIDVGDLNSSGQTAGELRVQSSVAINTGSLNASSTVGDGGLVFLDPPGDIVVGYINAQGGSDGEGGSVDVTTERFFRVTGTVPANELQTRIDQPVSIITTGGTSAGDITIRHGGNGDVPFDVGDAEVNGTNGALISGAVQLIPFRSFPGIYQEGTISILTRDPLILDLEVSRRTETEIEAPDSSPDAPEVSMPPPLAYITPVTTIDTIETAATSEFTDYLGQAADVPQVTLEEAQASLQDIEQAAGIQPAILYAFFVPAPVSVQVTNLEGLNELSNAPNDGGYGLNIGLADGKYLLASLPPSMAVGDRPTSPFFDFSDGDGADLYRWNAAHWNGAIAQAFANNEPSDTDELELILVTADMVVRRRIGGATRMRVQETANEFRNLITNPRRSDGYLPSAQALYRWIVEPLEPELQAQHIDNIAFVMDTGLRSLPVAALHDGNEYLIQHYSVGLMPTLSLTDTRYADIRSMNVLAMGAEQFSDLPPLPAVPL